MADMTTTDRSKFLLALLVIGAATGLLVLGQVGAVVASGLAVQMVAKAKAAAA